MKYFRIFDSTEAYLEYLDSPDAVFPNVVFCEDGYSYITPALEPVDVTGVTINTTATTINVGSTKTLVATVLPINATDKSVVWTSSDDSIATVTNNGMVTAVASGATIITVTTHDGGYTASCAVTVEVPSITTLVIEGAPVISAETCNYTAIGDNSEDVTSSATWSITSGSQYATINPNNGSVTILNGANESNVTIQAEYASLTATTNVTLTYVSGAESETEVESTTDIGGNVTTVATTITTYEDGSSVEASRTTVTDVNGDVVGTSESTKETNADGSYNGTTTNYDASGNPTDGSNVTSDTDGNVSTQTVEYDSSGNEVVTGYDIDTSETTGKTFNNDGANTEYYAFDLTHGFELDIDFTIDFSAQPSGQDENHHNIINSKRATPEPYYGFQIRHSASSGNTIQLGTQFSGSSNINTTIQPQLTGNTARYDLKIIYDPTKASDTFICKDMRTDEIVFRNNNLFPDIEELKNLKVTIGYAVNSSGNPFRYSNITVHNFELKKLKNVANPTITCENNVVTIDCDTVGASVYYRLNLSGDYSAYTTSFTITADTVVQAYATYSGDTSDIIREDCEYGLEKPVITCDGEEVTITCVNTGVTIYYRLNESGSYSAYTTPIPITADTVVEAYSQLGEETSVVVKETCLVNIAVTGVTLNENSITINRFETYTLSATVLPNNATNKNVTWSSSNVNVAIVDSNGVVSGVASGDATITVTTVDGEFTAQCSVSVSNHDYSLDYFTIESLENSNAISMQRSKTPNNPTLEYSLDSGSTWTTVTISGTVTFATINSGQTIIFKGNNEKFATAWDSYNYFNATKQFKVYGNIMSLINGSGFTENSEFANNSTHNFAGLLRTTYIVDASDLILPALTCNQDSYNGMFRGATNLQHGPQMLATMVSGSGCCSSMFEGCINLEEAPEINFTNLSEECCQRMFCMSRSNRLTTPKMTKSPILRCTTAATNCYKEMFKGNGNLNEITCLLASPAETTGWVLNAGAATGTFYKNPSATWTQGTDVPSGWDIVDYVEE